MLPNAIESILNQTYKNFELIIINDGSLDDTASILTKYAQKDHRIKILNNDGNKKIIYSRNRGIDAAKGKYIAWIDDDDIAEKNRLEEQVKFMEENQDITISGTDISLINGQGRVYLWPVEYQPQKAEIAFLIGRLPVILPTSIWRRSFIEHHKIRFDPEIPLTEDFAIYDKVLHYGGKITTLPKTLYKYRAHRNNPAEYYKQIGELQKSFYPKRWAKFYTNNEYPQTQCKRLEYIKNNNFYFEQKIVDEMYKKHCRTETFLPSGYIWFIPFADGSEAVVVSKNGHTFYSPKEKKFGTLMNGTDEFSDILWDDKTKIIRYQNNPS